MAKMNRFVFGMAFFALSGFAFAQSVTFHAGIDYTAWGVSQAMYNDDGKSVKTDPSAGYDPDGNMTIDVSVKAASFEFNLGLYFNADGGDEEYIDFSDGGKGTPFYQGNMKVGLFNDQLSLYTGKFEDFNGGYIAEGAVLGEQYITNLADSDYGPYLTGLEISPVYVSGLKFFAGFPILPIRGNGIQANEEYNQWKYLGKKVKLAAQYVLPFSGFDCTLNAGWRPGTYYDGVDNGGTMSTFTETFTKSAFGEAYIQACMPNLADLFNVTFSYDLRYRDDASYTNISGETVEHTALAHMIALSGSVPLSDQFTLAVEDRFFYADDDFIETDEKLLYNIFAVNGDYALSGTQFNIGLELAQIFAADANGKSFAVYDDTAKVNNQYYSSYDDIALMLNDMATANLISGTGSTNYLGTYAKPYFKYNFSNGYLMIACELAYTKIFTDDVSNSCLCYRVPVGIKFEF
ncbi:hypothetical protein [Treponema sp.]|uniref:hypothetical protein n=1 Tax=Treponema sp. TaxID=166 RepID=UPI00388DACB5